MNSTEIKLLALSLGADVCGVAGVRRFTEAPVGFHPCDILPGAASVIVFGKPFPKTVFMGDMYAPYMLFRENLLRAVDEIAVRLSMAVEMAGGSALPVPSSEPYTYWDAQNRVGRGILSLKHAAQLAGLGSIGKNTLLINQAYGNRLWLGAVVTDLKLEEDELTPQYCLKNCCICLDACPQKARDGVTIVQKKCREICFSASEGGGGLYTCNLCRRACPFSKA
jgi:epoxyqueuosine reductase QueG